TVIIKYFCHIPRLISELNIKSDLEPEKDCSISLALSLTVPSNSPKKSLSKSLVCTTSPVVFKAVSMMQYPPIILFFPKIDCNFGICATPLSNGIITVCSCTNGFKSSIAWSRCYDFYDYRINYKVYV